MMFCLPVAAQGQLNGRFHCLGAGIGEEKGVQLFRHDLAQFLGELNHWFVIDDVGLGVDDSGGLFLDRFDHFGMRVPGVGHADAAGEIEVPIAIHVIQVNAFATIGDDRGGSAPNRRNTV